MTDSDAIKELIDSIDPFSGGDLIELQRKFDIFGSRQSWKQVKELEDCTETSSSQCGEIRVI